MRPSPANRRRAPAAGIDSLLVRTAERHPDRLALVLGEHELAYGELDAAVDRLAARILHAGATGSQGAPPLAGTRIAVIAPNVPALVLAMFAAWRLGAVAVPLNARLREHELGQTLEDARASVLLTVRAHLGYSFADLVAGLAPGLPSLRACLFVDSMGEVEEEVPAARRPEAAEPLEPDVAAILYTSGTTGQAKGALVRHVREVEAPRRLAAALDLTPDDVSVFVIPISHAFGLTCLLATLAVGGSAVLVESTFTVDPLLKAIEGRRASVVHGSPSLFISLLKAGPRGLAGVRTGFVAGAPSPPGLLESLDRGGARILNAYGLTETGAVSCCTVDDPPEARHATAGRPLPGFELRLAPGEVGGASVGELQLRGPYVTPGYYRRPDETTRSFVDGWFRTGDLATLENGYVRISGRQKELVHVAGFNVFPAEVEGVLLGHPDVAQAAVVGVEHETMGEALRAFVVRRPGSDLTPQALLQFARGKIAGYKLPYAISILAELPLLPSGKPDRVALSRGEFSAPFAQAPR